MVRAMMPYCMVTRNVPAVVEMAVKKTRQTCDIEKQTRDTHRKLEPTRT